MLHFSDCYLYYIEQEGWLSPAERASVSAHFGLPCVRRWDNRGKCYMDEKRIQLARDEETKKARKETSLEPLTLVSGL